MIASHTTIPVIGVPILVYNDKHDKKSDKNKFSAFGGLDSLLSISEMPTGSPVVSVGVNKSANAGIYAMKILANEYPALKKELKNHKFKQHDSVLKESEDLRKLGLSKFVKKNSSRINQFLNCYNRGIFTSSCGVVRLSILPSQGSDPGFKSRREHILFLDIVR